MAYLINYVEVIMSATRTLHHCTRQNGPSTIDDTSSFVLMEELVDQVNKVEVDNGIEEDEVRKRCR